MEEQIISLVESHYFSSIYISQYIFIIIIILLRTVTFDKKGNESYLLAGVDDIYNIVDCDTGFGNVGRQDHLQNDKCVIKQLQSLNLYAIMT